MKDRHADRRIQETFPLLKELVRRLVNEQKFPSDYCGSALELAESAIIVLGGGRVPVAALIRASQAKRGGAQ
jgi:hypothetical protein